MMIVKQFILTLFQQNTRIVACERTKRAICVDPGEASNDLVAFFRDNDLTLQAITLTHGHLDHVGGTKALRAEFPDAEILLHQDDEELYFGLPRQPLFMGMPPHQLRSLGLEYDDPPALTRNWEHGEVYEVGDLKFKVFHCPGHTPGHIVLAEESEKKVFVGDCLFLGSIGRTDLPGGSTAEMLASLAARFLPLPDDMVVLPGHGPTTTVGRERATNPFLHGLDPVQGSRT